MSAENAGPLVLGVLWSEGAIGTLLMIARLYTRVVIDPMIGWDDWTMLMAIILDWGALAVLTTAVSYGLGRHQNTLDPGNTVLALQYQWIFQPLQVVSTTVARVSITILLVRLFPTKKLMKWFFIMLTTLNAVAGIVGLTLIFTQCNPPQALWDQSIKAKCISPEIQKNIATAKAAINGFTDLCTAIWPIAIIWGLRMKRRTKALLGAFFAMTVFGMVASVVEAVYLSSNAIREDATYLSAITAIWISTGDNIVIIVGSVPPLRPLYKKLVGSEYGRSSQRYYPRGRTWQMKDGGSYLAKQQIGITANTVSTGPRVKKESYLESEEHIVSALRDTMDVEDGIQMTTEVDVTFNSRRSSET